ncbi:ATPase with chaperone activity [Xylophilus rhododendri]|uniref:ATPase with chaperone activity n=1 Tax=Xylophilus rhododendri TaxID=2697032 RepID=A0A857JD19_9BURK|nr:ATPase with chaperone activity [Xylophilus rhododendri]QHJ01102.1 ATPase with chaperone activity [Xylophilus rhododendri]
MEEDTNQIPIPESFMALYLQRGRPTLAREALEARLEFCEDLAAQVSELCQTVQFGGNLSESEALRKCLDGLLQPPASVSPAEARWVMCRVAELLQWDVPAWLLEA